jgi:hypothetical protein
LTRFRKFFSPIDESKPSWGGYLKFVTANNPALPIRVYGGFDMDGKQQNNGSLSGGNALFFNAGMPNLCAGINTEIEEIRNLIELKIAETKGM